MNEFQQFLEREKETPASPTVQAFARAANPTIDFFPASLLVNDTPLLEKVQAYVSKKIKGKLHYASPKWEGSIVSVKLPKGTFTSEIHGASINKKTGQVGAVSIDLSGLTSLT